MQNLLDTITVVIALSPIIIQAARLMGIQTHNKKLVMLSDRAGIIVHAVEQLNWPGDQKKDVALAKLVDYAAEAHISITENQASDYIEGAVRLLKMAGGEVKANNTK